MTAPLAIVDGQPDTAFPAVVAIVSRPPACGAAEEVRCSGVLIAPRVVLTAAHCLEDRRPDELEIALGPDVRSPDVRFEAVDRGLIHPGYRPGQPVAGHDLALLRLRRPLTITPLAVVDATPAELVVGASVDLVAYGAPADRTDGGARLRASATLTEVTATELTTGAGGVPCGADSGGAVVLTTADGPRLVGAIKASGAGCTAPGLATALADEDAGFLAPFIAAADTDDPVRPTLAEVDLCAAPCDTVDDCPLGLLCLPGADGARCGYRDLRTVELGAACGPGPGCVVIGQGAERSCREAAPCPPPADGDPGGCGCGAGADPTLATALLAAALGWRVARRRQPR